MSQRIYVAVLGVVLALGLLAVVVPAQADESDQATRLTFNQSVDLPNHVALQAGTYWFVVDESIPNLVRVYDANRMHVYATMLTNSTIRPQAAEDTTLTFAEQSAKAPVALLSWTYPDRTTGHEFVFSARQQSQMDERDRITVTATPAS